jgi:magnesium transporter
MFEIVGFPGLKGDIARGRADDKTHTNPSEEHEMPIPFKSRSKKVGLAPGTPVHIGEKKMACTKITVFQYDETGFEEKKIETVSDYAFPDGKPGVTWINVDGLHESEALGKLGERLGLHPLVVEDILNTDQRPKTEDYGDYLFVVVKSLFHDSEESDGLVIEQISIVLGPNYVLSFQEREGDEFAYVRERIRTNKGRTRRLGADYLAYALLDLIVDQYFVVLERIGEETEFLEEELVTEPSTQTLQVIHQLKRKMVFLRRALWPLREVIGALERRDSPLIQEATGVYLRDVYDHTIQVIDAVETFRDIISGMLDIYLSSVSNRMNEVMKVLTIIATLFIPLTFIVGLYGMNFKHMPELSWTWGYPAVWAIMIVVAASMIAYFRRKRWL